MYVPEVMETAFLLREFQRRKIHMAIVVDEYGVTTGIVTFEDLMEIIVGEIQDMRNDNSDSLVRQLKSTEWIFDAMMDLEDFSELVEHDFDSDSVETIGGFVFEQVGALPEVGSRIVCDDFEFHVLEMEGYRIRKIKVVKVSS
jgi:CBS domain containing-hemolysin-like protein